MDRLQFLIVSDLHSTISNEYTSDSRFVFDGHSGECEQANALIDFIKDLDKSFYGLVCPGDISNKGDINGFKAGWTFLNNLKNELNIENLLCVPGNHDHQSRPGENFSTIHEIKFCEPIFPTNNIEHNTKFWGWHWSHLALEDVNVIILNSSAYHGLNDEYKHGRVAIQTIHQISEYLKSSCFNEKKFNLLLCHHHPVKMEHVDDDFDSEVMEGGQVLLKELESADVGPWLVIHGHKHFASLGYAMTDRSTPPVIFSAGSLGANLYPKIQDKTCNQFYILSIDLNRTGDEECLVGSFEAYSWNLQKGWHPSECNHLPYKGGFGSSIKPIVLVNKIKDLLTKHPYLDIHELADIQKEVEFYTPGQFQELINKMEKNNLHIDRKGNKFIEVAYNE
ncbi:hypothetical protein CTM97_19540 [Photobacterium phosphoreum]|uniref:Calcineurin-like phosphoesterase domain-containing protein n=1 Tax=Photobacterium phosphoreum TaxID=659 RepID=A0A2T3JEV3_PHOPO|nr:metallophosphoesterase [Photobacterium phosphoreum]PSU21414.1 hypothetical protein CTM96_17960 [Photobacterium phosphoreum]PSU38232.1 hypothetical protein CTM97_19540 [Photobacterium phosphoreum]PSU47448.1 hypothetical protein C9J18_18950 [Photobacterium phosphoreum]